MATATEPIVRDRLYIGGEWVEPAGEGTIDVRNPATGAAVARIPSTLGRRCRPTSARSYASRSEPSSPSAAMSWLR